ncbi:MAG: CoA-binding protein [Bacteroidetes bacterium]|nr:CoA-binding protein [Bacteroidota bacterium]
MKTLVLGASTNPSRYSFIAVNRLLQHGHQVYAVGIKKGSIAGIEINNGKPEYTDVDTVTLYLNPTHQKEWYSYLINLKPRRIIFNPGTENPVFEKLANDAGIETEEACTLVMLSTGVY